ncbi:hypothetical protein L914_18246, partial [Phytophthora nicotianae]
MTGGSKHTGDFRHRTEPFIFEWAAEQTSQRRNIGGSSDYATPLTAERRPVLLDRDVRQLVRAAATGDYFAAELKTKFSVKAS